MTQKTIKIPKGGLSVRASFMPETYNEEDKTIEVVFSTGSKGKRGFWDPYFEELSMKKSDVRLERLNSGAPVLNNHIRYNGLEGMLGKVEKAWIKEKQGLAKIRFSKRKEIEGIIQDIIDGIITKVSVGYTVHKYEDVSKKGDEIPTYRATDWEPMEISFVDIPFDNEAQSRSLKDQETYDCIITRTEENLMTLEEKIKAACKRSGLSDETAQAMIQRGVTEAELDGEIKRAVATLEKEKQENPVSAAPKVEPKAEDPAAVRSEPDPKIDEDKTKADQQRAAEKTRITEIRSVARDLGLDEKLVDEAISKDTTADAFRKMAIETRAAKDSQTKTKNLNIEVNVDQVELRKRGAENALLNKFDKSKYELTPEGKDFRFLKLTDLARKFLEASGINTSGMSDTNIADRALHSSSDFKEILANVANKSLMDAYSEAPQTFANIVNEVEVNDFKEISRTQLHSGAGLSKVNENGEYEHTTLSESAEKYSIQTYGKIIGITRKTLVNDDLGAFTRIPAQMGMKARSLESKLIWAIITSNPLMADGFALFSTEHSNIGTGVISVANVNTGMSKMMLQKDADDELIDIMPSYLVGPTALAATIKSFLGATIPSQDSNVNPFKGDLDPIIERRLDANSALIWYLMANKSMLNMIEIARLSGEAGPVITQKEGFDVDGLQIKVRYDFGAKVLDYRGFYRSTGA